jgi:hypothetical protein
MHYENPKFFASFTVKKNKSPAEVFTYDGPMPEEVMAAYAQVIGDGLAKVSVSADFGIKDFGNGVSCIADLWSD